MPIAVLTFQFDPFAHLFGDLTVRWGAIALVVVIVAALILAGVLARAGGLRPDDVALVAVGIVPGAVIGGRIGYFLVHAGFYGSAPGQLLDPSIGGLDLGLAVVGGFLTGCYVASLLGASIGRWLHVAAAPVLFALGAGKLTMVLTGSGQGLPEPRRLGDGLSRSRTVGLARPRAAVAAIAGVRGHRDARDPGRADRGADGRGIPEPRRAAVLHRHRPVGDRPSARLDHVA